MEEEKSFVIKMKRPTLSHTFFSIVLFSSMVLAINFHYSLSFIVIVPWIFFMIKEIAPTKLHIAKDSLAIGSTRLQRADIEKLVISNERIEIYIRNRSWLTKIVHIEVKNKNNKEPFNNAMLEWNTIS